MSSLGLGGAPLTPLISIMKLWSHCRRRPFAALNSHLINQQSIKTHEHLLTPASWLYLKCRRQLFSSVCKLGLAARLCSRPPNTLAVMLSPWGSGWMAGGVGMGVGEWGQSFISVQLTSVQLCDSGDG